MRSFENVVRDGRFGVPATDTPFPIGSPVMLDPANPGLPQLATAALAPSPLAGVVIYEHITQRGTDSSLSSPVDAPYNVVPLAQQARGLKAYYLARGGSIDASELTWQVSEVPCGMVGVYVWDFEDKFLTNFAESAQTLRDLAIPVGSLYFLSTPGLSRPALDAAIRSFRDATESGEVVIAGRPTMVNQIMDFDGYSDETLDEIRAKGMLGSNHGARIISLKNHKDEDGVSYMPADELWVMSKDTGKYALFGGLKSKEFNDLHNWYWHFLARRDTGILAQRQYLISDATA